MKALHHAKTVDIRKQFAGTGYLITDSEYDTTNVVCHYGHIYSDGKRLIAALTGDRSQCMALRKLGTVVMDGDWGEVSVAFDAAHTRAVCRIMKPRQQILSRSNAA